MPRFCSVHILKTDGVARGVLTLVTYVKFIFGRRSDSCYNVFTFCRFGDMRYTGCDEGGGLGVR